MLSQLSFDISNYTTSDTILLIGIDSNQSVKSSRCRTSAMNKFVEKISLSSVLEGDTATFHHNNNRSESQIDHVYYRVLDSSNITVDLHKHLCKLTEFSNLSSHDALIAKIALPVVKTQNLEHDYTSTYTPFIAQKVDWNDSGVENYQKQTSEKSL